MTVRIGKLKYPHYESLRAFRCEDLHLLPGDPCVARDADGTHAFAEVRTYPGPLPLPDTCLASLPMVVRAATMEDRERRAEHERIERHACMFCEEKIAQRQLPMRLLFVERPFERNRLIFHFEAEHRVDFRELVKDMAHMYNTRIEMRQDGVRDYAQACGGMGPCGKQLCCSQFMRTFGAVSIKMAKQQGLALNPNQISGMCGRLKCCLRYEYDPALRRGKRRKAGTAVGQSREEFDA